MHYVLLGCMRFLSAEVMYAGRVYLSTVRCDGLRKDPVPMSDEMRSEEMGRDVLRKLYNGVYECDEERLSPGRDVLQSVEMSPFFQMMTLLVPLEEREEMGQSVLWRDSVPVYVCERSGVA